MILEDQSILDELSKLSTMHHPHQPGNFPDNCDIMVASDGAGTAMVFQTGKVLVRKVRELLGVGHYRNARFQVGTLILGLLISFTAHHVFGRLGQAKVVNKLMFNSLPAMMCMTKWLYCTILICYGLVRRVMPVELYRCP